MWLWALGSLYVQLVLTKKLDAKELKGTRGHRAIALTSVIAKWYAAVLGFDAGEETGTAGLE